jgi:hypothetical protein
VRHGIDGERTNSWRQFLVKSLAMVLLSSLAFFAAGAMASAEPIRVAVAPILNTAPCKFAGPDVEQTHAIMARAATEYLERACGASDYVFVDPIFIAGALEQSKVDFTKPKERTEETLQAFGKAANANYALLILVEWTDQKNADIRAIAANAGGRHSTNKVRARFWVQNVSDSVLMLDGSKNSVEGEARGPYFGTVNPREMSGDPVSKGIVIQNEYKQRANWLGRALVKAIRNGIQAMLGLKEPPDRAELAREGLPGR